MKKIINILLFTGLIAWFSSCKKFLTESSQDLIRPETVAHYKELLQGEAYFKDIYKNGWFVDIMTDNVSYIKMASLTSTTVANRKVDYAKFPFQWAQDLENPAGTFQDRLFQSMYKNILTANACLEGIDKALGTEADKKVLKGQALFTRAYGYFVLANLYAKAYNESSDADLCVPLTFETSPSLKGYDRATMKEVWDLISNDIEAAVSNLSTDNVVRRPYEINYKAALLLASRIFLYKEEFEKAIMYGEKFLLLQPALFNISAITESQNVSGNPITAKCFLLLNYNPEIVFTFGEYNTSPIAEGGYMHYTREFVGLASATFSASYNTFSSLMETYDANDRRKKYWFAAPTGSPSTLLAAPAYTPMKVNIYEGSYTSQYMRGGEVYLNLAEAYARKQTPSRDSAIALLNQLRANRIGSYTSLTSADFASPAALTDFIWQERRRELCFEEFHRWWDLRRMGQPYLEHAWGPDVYKLNAKSPNYVLNFPRYELEFNPDLIPNPRQ